MKIAAMAVLSVAACGLMPTIARAQIPPSYGAYYNQNALMPGGLSPNTYMYDKYFYQRPTVSPYLNLDRPGGDIGTNYQTYVRPELQRREAAAAVNRDYIQQRKLEGRVGDTRHPGAIYGPGNELLRQTPKSTPTPSAYYNHWYGGWAK